MKPCAPGYFAAGGALRCTACGAGTYATGAAASCSACPAGSSCGAVAIAPTPCDSGFYSNESAAVCSGARKQRMLCSRMRCSDALLTRHDFVNLFASRSCVLIHLRRVP
jgi:hypothetical protein